MFGRERALEECVKRMEDLYLQKHRFSVLSFSSLLARLIYGLLLLHVNYGALLLDNIKRSRETVSSLRQSRVDNSLFLSKIHVH